MPGDLRMFDPGKQVKAVLVANAAGAVAERGQMVELVGERSGAAEVALADGSGIMLGHLIQDPVNVLPDDLSTVAAGDQISRDTVAVYTADPVDVFEGDPAAFTVGTDFAVSDDAGGVRPYDPVDTGADDQPEAIIGPAFRTNLGDEGWRAGRVAVVRQRQ